MKKTAQRCAARQDQSRARRPRSPGTLFGVTAHRSACCPRLRPPVVPTKSGTKTSELRAAPGSASQHRHRSHQTRALVRTMSASRSSFVVRVVCQHHSRVLAAPFHTATEKAREYDKKRRDRELA